MEIFKKYLEEVEVVAPNAQQAQQTVQATQQAQTQQAQVQQKIDAQAQGIANTIVSVAKSVNLTPAQVYSAVGQKLPKQ